MLAAGVALAVPSASPPAFHGRIVFEAVRTTRAAGLVLMDRSGSHRTRLPGTHTLGTFAVGRGAFAYTRVAADGELHAMVIDAVGTHDLGIGEPVSFSPDGGTVVVTGGRGWELRDRPTGAVRGTFPTTMLFFDWSPAGLLFEVKGDDVVVVQPDGSGARTIARDPVGRPTSSPDGRWIAYPTAGSPTQLHLVRPDGSGDHVVGDVSAAYQAVWSPDGSHLAFLSPGEELVLATPTGGGIDTHMPVVHSGLIGSWSPDGTRFAFLAGGRGSGRPELRVVSTLLQSTAITDVDADGVSWSPDGGTLLITSGRTLSAVSATAAKAEPRRLVTNMQAPAWLSDGRVVVFLSSEQHEQLASVPAAGGAPKYLPGTTNGRYPAVSPDGATIAFASYSDTTSRWTIWTSRADGSGRRRVADSGANAPSPAWSPNGRSIAYADYSGIVVVPPTGGRARRVASGNIPWTAAWSPTGRQIAFGDGDTDFADIAIVDRDGTHRHVVLHGKAGYNWGGLAWSPDGKAIAVARRSDAGGDPDGTADLYLVDLRTHRERELGLGFSDPSFSPNGKELAVADDDGTIDVIDLRNGRVHVVGRGSHPSWSR